MGQGPIPVYSQYPGGNHSALNITAAGVVVKSTPGTLYKASVVVAGATSGALLVADANVYVAAQTITAITAAAAAVVTISTVSTSNPFAVGNPIGFTGVGGMTQINTVVGQVTAIGGSSGAWTITTNINSSAFSAFTSGGTAASFSAATEFLAIPFGAAQGTVVSVEWPCAIGITVVGVAAGTPTYALSYL
jgi:hypothetical protein